MALDVYVKEDILNVLRALHVSSEVPTALSIDVLQDRALSTQAGEDDLLVARDTLASEHLLSYQMGFRSALASVALAFGLTPISSSPPGAPRHGQTQRYDLDLCSLIESMVRARP